MLLNEKLEKNIKLTTGLVIWLNYIYVILFFSIISLGYFISSQLKLTYLLEELGIVENRIYLENWFPKMKVHPKKCLPIQFQQGNHVCLFFRRKENPHFIELLTSAILYLDVF